MLFLVDDVQYDGGRFEFLKCTKERAVEMLKSGALKRANV